MTRLSLALSRFVDVGERARFLVVDDCVVGRGGGGDGRLRRPGGAGNSGRGRRRSAVEVVAVFENLHGDVVHRLMSIDDAATEYVIEVEAEVRRRFRGRGEGRAGNVQARVDRVDVFVGRVRPVRRHAVVEEPVRGVLLPLPRVAQRQRGRGVGRDGWWILGSQRMAVVVHAPHARRPVAAGCEQGLAVGTQRHRADVAGGAIGAVWRDGGRLVPLGVAAAAARRLFRIDSDLLSPRTVRDVGAPGSSDRVRVFVIARILAVPSLPAALQGDAVRVPVVRSDHFAVESPPAEHLLRKEAMSLCARAIDCPEQRFMTLLGVLNPAIFYVQSQNPT